MVAELEALRQAGVDVFSVAVSDRADEGQTRDISSWPQLRNINYFLSPAVTDLTSLTEPLAAQVSFRCAYSYRPMFHCSVQLLIMMSSRRWRHNEKSLWPNMLIRSMLAGLMRSRDRSWPIRIFSAELSLLVLSSFDRLLQKLSPSVVDCVHLLVETICV